LSVVCGPLRQVYILIAVAWCSAVELISHFMLAGAVANRVTPFLT